MKRTPTIHISLIVFLLSSAIIGVHDGYAKCDPLPLSVGFQERGTLVTSERAPERATAESPVVVALHGLGHNKEGFASLASVLPKTWRLIFVDAPFRYGQRGYAWYRFRCPERDQDISRSTKALTQLLKRLRERYPQAPISLFGFSQGGVMTLSALEQTPQLFKATASLSGYWGYSRSPKLTLDQTRATPSLLITHGRGDIVVPLKRGERAVSLMRAQGVKVTQVIFEGGHRITGEVIQALVRHINSRK